MHGGAAGSGRRPGNRSALRHGRYGRELIEFRRAMRELLRDSAETLELVHAIGVSGEVCAGGSGFLGRGGLQADQAAWHSNR